MRRNEDPSALRVQERGGSEGNLVNAKANETKNERPNHRLMWEDIGSRTLAEDQVMSEAKVLADRRLLAIAEKVPVVGILR